MKSILVLATLAASLTATPIFASNPATNPAINDEDSNIETGIGFGTGTIIGGVVAGPVGVVTGAFIGSLIGQNVASQNYTNHLSSSNDALKIQLDENSKKLLILEEDSVTKSHVLNDAHQTIEKLLTNNQELRNHALNFDVQFRTNSIYIEKQYQKYLSGLANALHTTPNIEIEIAGFSDRMGDEDYNMELSNQRAINVKDYLIKQGIKEQRITTLAYGESQPLYLEENLENNFFDRRVTVYLRPNHTSSKENKNLVSNDSLSIATK